jgi:hypothetical protein
MRRLGQERMKPNNTVKNAGMGPRVLTKLQRLWLRRLV